MPRRILTCSAALILALFVSSLPGLAPAAVAAEGYGIESMTAKDWNGMWGFQKRGFAECWLAGKRHQAARTMAALKDLTRQLDPQGEAAASVRAMEAELQTILKCQATPKELEQAVNRFYEAPGNASVLLGDALHFVILDLGRARPKASAPAG